MLINNLILFNSSLLNENVLIIIVGLGSFA